jgi:aldose 1-epimerase
MAVQLIPFGTLADGSEVRLARVESGDVALEVIEYGAAVRSLTVDGTQTVLGFDTLKAYAADGGYQGVIVGRVANRIDRACFEIDGEPHRVSANEGANCLHGGARGFNRHVWRFAEISDDRLRLAYASCDEEQGFPGSVDAEVEFRLDGQGLEIIWEAEADLPTPVNLTHHLYFNLNGDAPSDILDHRLSVRADSITPVRDDLIPTGVFMPVPGTPFDLRRPRRIGDALAEDHPQLAIGGGYDHNWVLGCGGGPALTLCSPRSGLFLAIETDHPGVQIYTGQGLGAPFGRHGGIAIEPQNFPNAVNQPGFPDAVLRPGERYRRRARYRFERGA